MTTGRPARPPLLDPGRTCWRTAKAGRVALLMDNSAFFAAAYAAIRNAKHSIYLLGWGFDPRTRMWPADADRGANLPDEVGNVLKAAVAANPNLDVRLLIWKSALPISISQQFFPHRSKTWFKRSGVHFLLDNAVPFGACHHQKVLIVDGKVAFCGGGDISVDRWDSPAHLDIEPRRLMPNGKVHPPRHEVMMMLDGEAAAALGEMAHDRWRRAGHHVPGPLLQQGDHDPWPQLVSPDFTGVQIGIARTEPKWRKRQEVREIEALHLDAIARARHTIYLENQYFTSPVIAEALARRLTEPKGPEIVLVSTFHSPSWFDQATMDRSRSQALSRLRASDIYGRFRAYCPLTRGGKTIIVHSKVAIIDNRYLRVGSANLNNRSAGFDTECDVMLEAKTDAQRRTIARFRSRLIGHFAGKSPSMIEELTREKGLVAALEETINPGDNRLAPLTPQLLDPLSSFLIDHNFGDPIDPLDAWRPFLRRRRLQKRLGVLGRRLSGPAAFVDAKIDHQR
ncbi:MAG: phospholipase D-like domain-containing protein [Caulobacteraceae bacterium]